MQKYTLYFAWLLAAIGSLGSLFFSEILNFEPCHLCWYQRAFLFPLAIILGIGAYFGDCRAIRFGFPLALIGFCIALYQISIQEIPGWNVIDLCGRGPPCSHRLDIGLGFITLPMLSALDFASIALLLLLSCKKR